MQKLALVVAGCAVAAFAPAAGAQQTLVVDAANGPWFSLELAIEAANPGDTLLVQPGTYGAPVLDRGLRVVFAPGLYDMFSFEIAGVPAGQEVVVAGLQLDQFSPHIYVSNCAGRVHVEDTRTTNGMTISNCAQVSMRGCDISGIGSTGGTQVATLNVTASTLVMTSCSVSFSVVLLPVLPMNVSNSDVTIVDCSIGGGLVVAATASTPGLRVSAGVATIAGDASSTITAPTALATTAAAVELTNGAVVRVDPDVALLPNGAVAPVAGAATMADAFFLTGDYDNPPLLTLDATPAQEVLGVVFAGWPSSLVSVPLFADQAIWLDAAAFPLAPMLVFGGAPANLSLGVAPLPPGTDIAFQAVGLLAGGGVSLSTPLVLTVDL